MRRKQEAETTRSINLKSLLRRSRREQSPLCAWAKIKLRQSRTSRFRDLFLIGLRPVDEWATSSTCRIGTIKELFYYGRLKGECRRLRSTEIAEKVSDLISSMN